jgi:GDP-L-fucose synthase
MATAYWEDRNIIVTGQNGFLGSHLCARLKAAGAVIANESYPRLNLRNEQDTICLFKKAGGVGAVSILFHLAATVGGIGANLREPAKFLYDNTMMNLNVAEWARQFEVGKFVGVGSVCMYPKFTPVPFNESNLFEGYPEETNAPYGISKRALLVYLQSMRTQYEYNGIFLIPTNLYGPRDTFDPTRSHVIPALIRKIDEAQQAGSGVVEVWGDGSPTRDFLYVDDCARALMLAAEKYNRPDPVNLGSGTETRIDGLCEILKDVMDYDGRFEFDESKPGGQPRRCLNTSRALNAFGWAASTRLEEGLGETVEWWRGKR